MKVLLLGKYGQVGYELNKLLKNQCELIALDREDLDLQDLCSVKKTIQDIKPQIVINAAAYTAVDRAETEPETVRLINGILPGVLAEETKKIHGVLIHYSTDFVFDGKKKEPYLETDQPKPLSVYGRSKLEGEENIKQVGTPFITLRTSWVYGARGHNFALTMLKLAREREILKVVDDQTGTPTWCKSLAEATREIVQQGRGELYDYLQEFMGIYHFTSKGETTWFKFAKEVLETDPHRKEQYIKEIIPITTAEYPTQAERPSYSVLDTRKIENTFKLNILSWEDYLQECFTLKEME